MRTSFKTIVAAIGVAILLQFSAPAFANDADVAWAVQTANNDNGTDRPNFAYELEPGAVIHDAMIVTNTGKASLDLSVYAADAFTTPTGNLDILPAGEASTDSGTWITASTSAVKLGPGEQATLEFTITVPKDASPGDHPAGIVTSLASDVNATVTVDRRLGARINIRVAGELAPSASIHDVSIAYDGSWNPFAPGTATVTFTLRNTGNTRITALDTTAIAGPLGVGAVTAPGEQTPEIMPGSSLTLTRTVEATSFGWLSANVSVTPQAVGLGTASLAPLTADVQGAALPWGLLVLIAALIAAAIVVTIIVIRKRRVAAE